MLKQAISGERGPAFWSLWQQWKRKKRVAKAAAVTAFEDYLLTAYAANLKGFLPLAFDCRDTSAAGSHAVAVSGVTFSGPTPAGMRYPICAKFDGAASQVRLEEATYPFGLSRWTVSCWFKKLGPGVATNTASAADGFPVTDPVVPLVTKGRGESDGSNVDMNWLLGLNRVNNGAVFRLAGDFEDMTASNNNHRIVGATDIVDGQWYHGVFTFDGAQMKLYLNGVLEATVATSASPRSDSIQKAGIGTAYTSTSVAAGFFQGMICSVAVWSQALGAGAVSDIYARGVGALRPAVAFFHGAPDNVIQHGAYFRNWTVDLLGSSHGVGGVTLLGAVGNYAKVSVNGLSPGRDYWCRCVVSAKSVGAVGTLRVVALGTQGSSISGVGGAVVNIGAAVGTFYFKVRTDASAAPHVLVIEHVGSPSAESFSFSALDFFGAPARSSAKTAILGDRTGGFDFSRAASVDGAILSADADTLSIVSVGDTGDSVTSFATANDALKNAIIGRGGKVLAGIGNHDYDGTLEAGFAAYWNITEYNVGKFYYSARLGEVEFFFFDDMNDLVQQPENGGGCDASAGVCQLSVAGRDVLSRLAKSAAKWVVFVFHHPAYSSSASGSGWPGTRWDWGGLSVPLVLQSHTHGVERIFKDGLTFYTVAMGGGNHHGWAARLPETQFRVEDQAVSGFLKIHDSLRDLVLEYFDTNLVLLDRIRIARHEGVASTPSNFLLTDMATYVLLDWASPGNEVGYRLYRRVNGGAYSLYQTLAAGQTQALDSAVTLGTAYDYYVAAYNSLGESGPSDVMHLLCGA
jgi:hypothetical protein